MLLRALLLSSLLAAAGASSIPGGEGPCRTDDDCSLNGVCTSGTCDCDAAWTGPRCALLDLLPTSQNNGLRMPGITTWGGSILRDSDRGFAMFLAKMVNGCDLGSWTTNSEVVVATSKTAVGPYEEAGSLVAPPWAHNPQAIYVPDDMSDRVEEGEGGNGTYCVYTLGDGVPRHGPVKDCAPLSFVPVDDAALRESTEKRTRHRRRLLDMGLPDEHCRNGSLVGNHTVSFTIWHSTTGPLGPWLAQHAEITDFPCAYQFPGNWNPSPVLLPDGRVRIMVHTNTAPWAGEVIVEAPTWRGPYKPITRDITTCTKCEEDPFIWIDGRGHYHVLYHRMFDPPGSNPIPSPGWVGGHSYSRDGLRWSPIERAYNTTVQYDDGTSVEMLRRERPKLIFDEDGVTPTHMTNGVIDPDGVSTYTLVVPLRTP